MRNGEVWIEEALDKAGLGWKVTHGDVLVVKTPE